MRKSEIANPGGCQYCGQPRYFHCQRWHGNDRGFEGFIEPTQEQIKERMWARREAKMSLSERAQIQPDEVPEIIDFIEKNFSDGKDIVEREQAYPNDLQKHCQQHP